VPRKKNPVRLTSGLRRMQSQARTLLASLREEIRDKEAHLKRLKEHQSGLGRLAGGGEKSGGRVNWRSVLEQLPKQFSAADVRAVRGLKSKRPAEIFAAITRWIEAGLAQRKSRGAYEKS